MAVAALAIVAFAARHRRRTDLRRTPPASAVPARPGGGAVTDSFYFVHQPLTGDGSITVPGDLADRRDPRRGQPGHTAADGSVPVG